MAFARICCNFSVTHAMDTNTSLLMRPYSVRSLWDMAAPSGCLVLDSASLPESGPILFTLLPLLSGRYLCKVNLSWMTTVFSVSTAIRC